MPKGVKNKLKSDIQPVVTEVIKEVIKEVIREVPSPELKDYALYKKLKDCGFPQGGIGSFMESVNSTEKVYVPHVSECYNQFIAEPKEWDKVRDALCRCWIEKNEKH
jgi:hypothetical protein